MRLMVLHRLSIGNIELKRALDVPESTQVSNKEQPHKKCSGNAIGRLHYEISFPDCF